MPRIERFPRVIACAIVATAAMTLAACSLDKQETPPLSGPSELALSLTLTASPDQLPRDGSSRSIVTITARGVNGQPLVGQRVSLSLGANAPQGAALSASEVTTGSSGTATFSVSAPVSGSVGDITVTATPVGTSAGNSSPRIVQIRATPSNTTAPTAAFTFSPASPEVGQAVTFNASTTTDEGVSCGGCIFTWNFGGDGTASGIIVTHAFSTGGSFAVTLSATDSAGMTSTAQQTVTVTTTSIPTGVSVSPTTANAKQPQTFTASATASTNHRIVSYQWSWGDGNSQTTTSNVVQHTYSQTGSYLLSLTVVDDLGQTTTINTVITVSSGLSVDFSTSKSGTTVTFDACAAQATCASHSNVGSTITDYAWDFDSDGTYDKNGTQTIVSHDYGANGTYRATLKITDDRGVTATVTKVITLP
ncbi:MAG: PKD domain-containing protein [Candidatus Dormibacteria bacterium]